MEEPKVSIEDPTIRQVKAIVADYYETVAEARSTYVRTEASKIWLADAIIDLFKDEFKEAENDSKRI